MSSSPSGLGALVCTASCARNVYSRFAWMAGFGDTRPRCPHRAEVYPVSSASSRAAAAFGGDRGGCRPGRGDRDGGLAAPFLVVIARRVERSVAVDRNPSRGGRGASGGVELRDESACRDDEGVVGTNVLIRRVQRD